MMHSMKYIFALPLLIALGEVPIPGVQQIAQLGALGVLTWFCFAQHRELQEIRRNHNETIDKLVDRWDGWEQLRHRDSEKLDETLLRVVAQCERRNPGYTGREHD